MRTNNKIEKSETLVNLLTKLACLTLINESYLVILIRHNISWIETRQDGLVAPKSKISLTKVTRKDASKAWGYDRFSN